MNKQVPLRLKQARDKCGKSQAEVAADSGISSRTVSRIESGNEDSRTRKEVLIRLALATDQRPTEWLEIAGYSPNPELIDRVRKELETRIPLLRSHRSVLDGNILPLLKAVLAEPAIKRLTFKDLQEIILLKARQQEIEKKIKAFKK